MINLIIINFFQKKKIYTNCADITVTTSSESAIQPTQSLDQAKTIRTLVRRTTTPINPTTTSILTSTSISPSRILRTRSTLLTTTTTLKKRDPSTIRFICSKSDPPVKNAFSDQFKYRGSAVMCFWVDKTSAPDCDYCKDNCVTDE
jgi:hypothetical protein